MKNMFKTAKAIFIGFRHMNYRTTVKLLTKDNTWLKITALRSKTTTNHADKDFDLHNLITHRVRVVASPYKVYECGHNGRKSFRMLSAGNMKIIDLGSVL